VAESLKSDGKREKTWQQTKSEQTRTAILDAAIACFYDLGYSSTTTDNIATRAGVSRGAMLHHFPTRFDLIKAAVRHLSEERLARFEEEESQVNLNAEHTRVEEGIDAFWKQLNSRPYIVFQELRVAARTDKELEDALVPALEDFEKAFYQTARKLYPDLVLSEAYDRGNYLTRYLLEGMAAAKMVKGAKVPEKQMLSWLKRELRRSYQDVLNTVKRPTDTD
jgi:AcrR family transcriptional regulator